MDFCPSFFLFRIWHFRIRYIWYINFFLGILVESYGTWLLFQRLDDSSKDSDIPKNVPFAFAINNRNTLWACVCARARMGMCVRAAGFARRSGIQVFRLYSMGMCVQSHKARAFRDGGAYADVSRHRGRRLQDNPP